MGFILKNIIYAFLVSVLFIFLLVAGDLFGLKAISACSTGFLGFLITFMTFNMSVLNIRFR